MTKKIGLIAGVLTFAAVAVFAQAPGAPPAAPPPTAPPAPVFFGPSCPAAALLIPPPMLVERPPAQLNLTNQQKTKLKDILTKAMTSLQPLRQASAKAARELSDAVTVPNADAAKVQSLIDASVKAETAYLKAEVDIWKQVGTVLSADQMKTFNEMMSGRRPVVPPMLEGTPGAPPPRTDRKPPQIAPPPAPGVQPNTPPKPEGEQIEPPPTAPVGRR